jgi:serine/threonine-protein kinase
MEYVHGKDLRKVIKKLQQTRAALPLGEALHVVREVAQALHHAYWSTDMTGQRLSVVHRDVSPQNIILSYDGAVKLLDFGVAMSAVTEQAENLIVGKWLYMSPESTTHEQVDHRSDLFSLGVILYLLCSGYMPFTGREPREIVRKIRGGQYKPLQELVAIPERLAMLSARLLAPNPDDRPQRGQEVAAELADIARQYAIESSGPNIAYILKQLFPSETGGAAGAAEPPAASVREIVMSPQEAGSTGTGGTTVDSSVANIRRSREYSAPVPNVAAGAFPPSAPVPASTVPRTQAPIAPLPPRTSTPATVPPINRSRMSSASSVPPIPSRPQSVPPPNVPIAPNLPVAAPVPAPVPASLPHGPSASPAPVPGSMPPASPPVPASPDFWQNVVPPVQPPTPARTTNLTGMIITIAVVVLLAVGMYLLVRPS